MLNDISLDTIDKISDTYKNLIINMLFIDKYPSILKYYYDNYVNFKNIDISGLYQSIDELLLNEYHLLDIYYLNENIIIDILNLWKHDNIENFNIGDISISHDMFIDLSNNKLSQNLIQFLLDNNIHIV